MFTYKMLLTSTNFQETDFQDEFYINNFYVNNFQDDFYINSIVLGQEKVGNLPNVSN